MDRHVEELLSEAQSLYAGRTRLESNFNQPASTTTIFRPNTAPSIPATWGSNTRLRAPRGRRHDSSHETAHYTPHHAPHFAFGSSRCGIDPNRRFTKTPGPEVVDGWESHVQSLDFHRQGQRFTTRNFSVCLCVLVCVCEPPTVELPPTPPPPLPPPTARPPVVRLHGHTEKHTPGELREGP